MREKILRAFVAIEANKDEVSDVVPSGAEYYFVFRSRVFSVGSVSGSGVFYIYPRFHGTPHQLAEASEQGIEHPDLTFLSVSDAETNSHRIAELHLWMQSKFMGIDDLLRDIGVN